MALCTIFTYPPRRGGGPRPRGFAGTALPAPRPIPAEPTENQEKACPRDASRTEKTEGPRIYASECAALSTGVSSPAICGIFFEQARLGSLETYKKRLCNTYYAVAAWWLDAVDVGFYKQYNLTPSRAPPPENPKPHSAPSPAGRTGPPRRTSLDGRPSPSRPRPN